MIKISDKDNCCGCEACVQACPKQCISIEIDTEGFHYPTINESMCINCGACKRSCPMLSPFEKRIPQRQFAAVNPNTIIRKQSSSGGIFSMLAEQTISNGGVVFGARFDDKWQVVIDYTTTHEGLASFRGSKYIQGRVGDAFSKAKSFLKEGKKVLFSATPCQIAGLKHFLNKDYDNLLCVDFICHGVPSPKVWKKYLDEVTHNAEHAITDIQYRNKKQGWKQFHFDLTYHDEGHLYRIASNHKQNAFMRVFLKDVILRPSCYSCKAKSGRSRSDITLADFWGIEKINPQLDDDIGTSLVLVNTKIGEDSIRNLNIEQWETSYGDVLRCNPAIEKSPIAHSKRAFFFSQLDASESILTLIEDTLRESFLTRIKQIPLRVKGRLYKKYARLIQSGDRELITNTIPNLVNGHIFVSFISFRTKELGWKNFSMTIEMKTGDK